MYIISKFKDYYDSVAGQKGIDKTIVFERMIIETEYSVLSHKKYAWRQLNLPEYGDIYRYGRSKVGSKSFELFLVGFCGKIYIGAKVVTILDSYKTDTTYIYGLDNIKEQICIYFKKPDYFNSDRLKHLEHIISLTTNSKALELFYTYKTPQFILYKTDYNINGGHNLIINGSLKDIQFYKHVDTAEAFQEIEMYITGVLGINNKPMVEISDKHKIVGHGFDPKWSFRKEPEKKK